jgi:hypothetical protein
MLLAKGRDTIWLQVKEQTIEPLTFSKSLCTQLQHFNVYKKVLRHKKFNQDICQERRELLAL